MSTRVSNSANEWIVPFDRKSKLSGSFVKFSCTAVIGSDMPRSLICLVESASVAVHGRPKIKRILKAGEALTHRIVQRRQAGIGLRSPEESRMNVALMYHA